MKHLPIIWLVFCAVIAGLIMGIGDNNAWPAEEITAYKANDGMLFESKEKAREHDKRKELRIATYKAFDLDPVVEDSIWVYGSGSTGDHCEFVIDNSRKIYRLLKSFYEEKKTEEKAWREYFDALGKEALKKQKCRSIAFSCTPEYATQAGCHITRPKSEFLVPALRQDK